MTWLRLRSKRAAAGLLELELEAHRTKQDGPGLWASELVQLLTAGDRVRVRLDLQEPAQEATRAAA